MTLPGRVHILRRAVPRSRASGRWPPSAAIAAGIRRAVTDRDEALRDELTRAARAHYRSELADVRALYVLDVVAIILRSSSMLRWPADAEAADRRADPRLRGEVERITGRGVDHVLVDSCAGGCGLAQVYFLQVAGPAAKLGR